ncbi:MAG: 8-amino-7-oxononanoate synthase [Gammaproteobacteria bacterium]|nr:MAG: 8-amino-7-oxononanoate synthase [Gammaproteobacteria bacterium]
MRDLAASLARWTARGWRRRLRTRTSPPGPEVVLDGRRLLAFCTNDYLGLAGHPALVRALCEGAQRYGTGSSAAHLLGGHTEAHARLEAALAEFVGFPRARLFATGYAANLALVSMLAERGEPVYHDRLNHASLLDGTALARARVVRYAHADADDLARRLDANPAHAPLVVTDGVFSMDGDLAPLPALARVVREHGGALLVDDAHGLGVLGPQGRGSLAQAGVGPGEVQALVGTLGKAFGTAGAFVAGDETLVDGLVHFGRPWIYSTAPPPALAHATLQALALVRAGEEARRRLFERVHQFRRGARELGLPLAPSETPIQPLLVGDAQRAQALSAALLEAGIWVPAIRPPTVPEGTARLRITLSAAHTREQVDRLLEALARAWAAHPAPEEA